MEHALDGSCRRASGRNPRTHHADGSDGSRSLKGWLPDTMAGAALILSRQAGAAETISGDLLLLKPFFVNFEIHIDGLAETERDQ